ncbi:YeeE/YedE family protein [Roseomonas chloroacetimidivorans]|uniref:YeeE/YedE family protein n=1 Tax=Roseomonas chloroacetimidivorans TaxID=1766656 RepID=UPI003C73199B
MENFTPVSAFFGGVLIGLSVVVLLLTNGRIAGVSGVVGGLLASRVRDAGWRLAFILGLIAAPLLYAAVAGGVPPIAVTSSTGLLIVAGLLVGFGARLGSGCTSGHGVAGIARLSPRSFVATGVFLTAGMVTVFVTRHVMGG